MKSHQVYSLWYEYTSTYIGGRRPPLNTKLSEFVIDISVNVLLDVFENSLFCPEWIDSITQHCPEWIDSITQHSRQKFTCVREGCLKRREQPLNIESGIRDARARPVWWGPDWFCSDKILSYFLIDSIPVTELKLALLTPGNNVIICKKQDGGTTHAKKRMAVPHVHMCLKK